MARLTAPLRRAVLNWGKRSVMRRLERELAEYRHPPEVKLGLRKRRGRDVSHQTFRSLIQVNFYPRERP